MTITTLDCCAFLRSRNLGLLSRLERCKLNLSIFGVTIDHSFDLVNERATCGDAELVFAETMTDHIVHDVGAMVLGETFRVDPQFAFSMTHLAAMQPNTLHNCKAYHSGGIVASDPEPQEETKRGPWHPMEELMGRKLYHPIKVKDRGGDIFTVKRAPFETSGWTEVGSNRQVWPVEFWLHEGEIPPWVSPEEQREAERWQRGI